MMNLMKGIARFAPAIGLLALGPVLTMIIAPEKFGDYYVYGAIDGLLVGFAIMSLSNVLSTTSKRQGVAG